MGYRRLIVTVVLTAVLAALAQPLYSVGGIWTGIINSRNNKTVRLDLLKTGGKDNRLTFSKMSMLRFSSDRCPAGTEKSGCYAIEGGLKSKWRAYELTAQAAADGEVKIVLKSPVRDGRITRTDFRGLKINGREMFRGERAFSVMHPYEYTTKIKKGETLRLAFEARRHRFAFADLKEYGINFCMLFTVTVVSFLLAYGLVAYVSRFKLLEHGSRIDIVFVCVFFFLLLVPASKISREEKSVQENRRLAAYVPLFSDQGLNNRFGQDFEAWFNDRFNYREAVISFYSGLEMLLNSRINNKVAFFNKKTHWLFNNEQLKIRKLSRQTEDRVLRELSAAGRFFRGQGIKTYMLMVPGKIDIYAKAAEPYYKVRGIQNEGTIKRMMSELPFPVVYPLAELQEGAKENFVFFKTEHHWTEWGAYLGYRKLMQTIAKDFPAAGAVGEDAYDIFYKRRVRGDWDREDFTLGQTFVQMNVKYPEDKLLDVEYKYYNPKKVLAEDVNDTEMTKHYHNPDGNGLRVMLIGTSMSENLLQFLPQNFSELKYFRTNNSPIVPVAEEKKIMKRYLFIIIEKATGWHRSEGGYVLRAVHHVYALAVVIVGWVLFRSESLSYAAQYLKNMTGMMSEGKPLYELSYYIDNIEIMAFVAGIVCALPVFKGILSIEYRRKFLRGAVNVWLMVLFLLSSAAMAASTYNPFIYFRF